MSKLHVAVILASVAACGWPMVSTAADWRHVGTSDFHVGEGILATYPPRRLCCEAADLVSWSEGRWPDSVATRLVPRSCVQAINSAWRGFKSQTATAAARRESRNSGRWTS
jgi:hypothetical protein